MRVLITGGLGLVGSSYAEHCLRRGDHVVLLDNRARGQSCDLNLDRLSKGNHPGELYFIDGNVALEESVLKALEVVGGQVDRVVHAAAQSSVNRSMDDPGLDFSSNVIGTFVLLETLRRACPSARVLFLASNKVYDVTTWPTEVSGTRYRWVSRRVGPSEDRPFHTDAREPYGASKIAGFYYSRCYAAMYNMPIIIGVPSGMYGPYQYGKSEQGWLGWMVIATLLGLPITIHGDGRQVRDMLHVHDVCSAFDLLLDNAEKYRGEVFNLGGGPRNAVSLVEALSSISAELGKPPILEFRDWRPQDNKVYVSNIERMLSLGWFPSIEIKAGIRELCQWAEAEKETLTSLYKEGRYAA